MYNSLVFSFFSFFYLLFCHVLGGQQGSVLQYSSGQHYQTIGQNQAGYYGGSAVNPLYYQQSQPAYPLSNKQVIQLVYTHNNKEID